jgi:hypothetical protein
VDKENVSAKNFRIHNALQQLSTDSASGQLFFLSGTTFKQPELTHSLRAIPMELVEVAEEYKLDSDSISGSLLH